MSKITCCFLIIMSLISCKVKTINETINHKREGLWVEEYAIDSDQYKSIGTYKEDDLVKKWRYYTNGNLIKKERYHNQYCKTKFFNKNRTKQASGRTQIDQTSKEIHWYYSGKWKFYDNNGKLKTVRIYDKGNLISEQNK